MPHASAADGVKLYYEEVGQGTPIVFVHEFADDIKGWAAQVKFFARRYRTIAFNARGYPPSDVPDDPERYSQAQAAEDIKADPRSPRAWPRPTSSGCRWAATRRCTSASCIPSARCRCGGGAGYGSVSADRATFHKDTDTSSRSSSRAAWPRSPSSTRGGRRGCSSSPRIPVGWQEFYDRFAAGSARGHANTMRGVQRRRPSIFELEAKLRAPRRCRR